MRVDTHTHSEASFDCRTPVADQATAIRAGTVAGRLADRPALPRIVDDLGAWLGKTRG